MDGEVAIIVHQGMVEVDHALHEGSAEDPDAAEIEQVHRSVRLQRVVA